MKVTILGSGTSTGVPVIGCYCEVCSSTDLKDQRTRSSILIETSSAKKILIDTGPDLRMQLLRAGVGSVDALFYTHLHADHCHGFDDLRAFYFKDKKPLQTYLARNFSIELQDRFKYAFFDSGYPGATPHLNLNIIPDDGVFDVGGCQVETFRVPHGNVMTSVFRLGEFVYATDFKKFSDEQISRWRGKVKVMVASGVHFDAHPTHSTISETLDLFDKLQVKRGVISHLSHKISYLRDGAAMPPHVSLAYDGMRIDVS